MTRRVGADCAAEPAARVPDDVIVEEPMEIRLDDRRVATTMRTPGNDFELAVGFCHSEGLLAGHLITEVRYCATGSAVDTRFNVVSVDTGGRAPEPTPRLGTTTSSCGVCGADSIEALTARLVPLPPHHVDFSTVLAIGTRIESSQKLFDKTGGVHAAAAFDVGSAEPVVVREDIGRHNAVDKVVGRLLLDGLLPASSTGLWVSGRASFEIVQKAWSAGIGLVVSVSAASSLAVATAKRANISLIGFARDGSACIYE